MQMSSWAIRRPIPTIVLFLLLTIAGILSFSRLPVNADPSVSFPVVTISVSRAGASPDELENSVTRQVESAVSGMAGVRHVTTEISDGVSMTTVEFQLQTDTDRAVNDVRNAITQIRSELPQDISEPLVERVDMESGALAYYALESPDKSMTDLSWFVDEVVTRRLLAVSGVQKVDRTGGTKQEITLALRPERLDALGITADQINTQLTQTNANLPAGRTEQGGNELSLRVLASATSLENLGDLPIALSEGRYAKLSELAEIIDGHQEIRSRVRLNGREVVGFNVFRAKGSSDTVVAEGVEKAVAELQQDYPDIRILNIHSTVDGTRENYDTAITTLLEGALLTVLVVFLFLRNWRSTLVAALALPLSILPTFIVMQMFGYTLNSVTLLGITLVIGILVDDAIVEIENIENHLAMGKRPFQASIDAADAIGFAVVAITGTIVAVFLPVSFISGIVGRYFSQFGITVSVAVLASLLTARLATPLLAAYLLAPHKPKATKQKKGRMMQAYLRLLTLAMRYRKTTLGAGLAVFVLSLMMVPYLPTGFMPKGDVGYSTISVKLPPGSTLAQTDETLKQITQKVLVYPEVARVYATAGSNDDVAKGEVLVRLKPHNERDIQLDDFEQKVRDELVHMPDIRFAVQNESSQRDIDIILTGNNGAELSAAAHQLKAQMQALPSVANVQINEPLPKPELQVRLLADEAARAGVTPQAVGNLLRIATIGGQESESARYNLPDRQIMIRTVLPEALRDDIQVLKNLRVSSSNGGSVPLHTIADVSYATGSATISRFDRARRISVEADLVPGYTVGDVLDAVDNLPIMKNLPAGVQKPNYGDAEYMNEMFEQFALAMGFGILMVLLVLILLFRDFLQPLTILTALPLSLGGALGGLMLYNAALDLSSVIGILMLMGIVTKNSILLIDFVIEKRRHGISRARALYRSGAERARPIIMTTIAMVAGMIPAVFAGGSGAAFRAPMAVAVIGGLLVSTALSLVFVPVFYSLMDDLRNWLAPRLARLTSVTAEDRAKAEQAEG